MNAAQLFEHLWEDYIKIAPAAKRLHDAVAARGETVINDHVAFRTYDIAPINLDALEKHILSVGYKHFSPYDFPDKKLRAYGYTHPEGYPHIFFSELKTREFSPALQKTVKDICAQIDPAKVDKIDVLWSGRLWSPVSYQAYLELLDESEYAAWVAAIGLRTNHFTISVNHLATLNGIEALADFIEEHGFTLNTSGGRVKGSEKVLLKQGSTMADEIEVEFAGGEKHKIRSCYYEFAQRYPQPDGKLYQGFVAASADKIFESTNVKN